MSILRGVSVVMGIGLLSATSCGTSVPAEVAEESPGLSEAAPPLPHWPPWRPTGARLSCVQIVSSLHSFSCRDAGGIASTCATAKCPEGYTLTGGGGACAAGDRRVKSLFPKVEQGEFTIVCEEQGTAPEADAICCKL